MGKTEYYLERGETFLMKSARKAGRAGRGVGERECGRGERQTHSASRLDRDEPHDQVSITSFSFISRNVSPHIAVNISHPPSSSSSFPVPSALSLPSPRLPVLLMSFLFRINRLLFLFLFSFPVIKRTMPSRLVCLCYFCRLSWPIPNPSRRL